MGKVKEIKSRRQKKTNATNTSKQHHRFNGWMWAFIVLCGLIIGAGGATAYTLTRPVTTTTKVSAPSNQGTVMRVSLTKLQLNRLLKNYLSHYLQQGDIKYSLSVGDHAVLKGSFKFFGAKVGFGMQCDPYVQTNGNVILKATKINVGALSVPISYVMGYVQSNYNLPKMVSVDSKENSIVLRLNQFDLGNGLHVRADRIDLVHDKIDLTGYLSK